MNGWSEGIAEAIAYIEENLAGDIDVGKAAAKAGVSEFYFRRIFAALCGTTVGEYIRNRRLTLAAQELCSSDIKVIDAALRYGYDSPDSFARAFAKFHGASPSLAKERGVKLRSAAPLKIILKLEGGTMLEYKIVEKAQFTIVGKPRKFSSDASYAEIPKFWDENNALGEKRPIMGMYGLCWDGDGKNFEYFIADDYTPLREVPEGCVTKVIPEGTWAVFSCRGKIPGSLQELNTEIWSEWLPACKAYKLAGNYNLEVYPGPIENAEDYYSEIWVPVEPIPPRA